MTLTRSQNVQIWDADGCRVTLPQSTTRPQPEFLHGNGTSTLHFHQPKFYFHEHIFFSLKLLTVTVGITLHMTRSFLPICKQAWPSLGSNLSSKLGMSRPTGKWTLGKQTSAFKSITIQKGLKVPSKYNSPLYSQSPSIALVPRTLIGGGKSWPLTLTCQCSYVTAPNVLVVEIWSEQQPCPGGLWVKSTHSVSTKQSQMSLEGSKKKVENMNEKLRYREKGHT